MSPVSNRFSPSRRLITVSVAALALFGSVGISQAQGYAQRAVHIVVPFPAGGGVDMVARLMGNEMSKQIGQPMVIENRAGAGGNIGAAAVARSKPDGHTLLLAPAGVLALAPLIMESPGYSPSEDLTTVAVLVMLPQLLTVSADSPFKTLDELIDHARANPGKLTIASSAKGTGQHLATELFMKQSGTNMLIVPYAGSSDAVRAVLGGDTDATLVDPASLPLVRSGKLRVLGVTTEKRVEALPDTPAIAEVVEGYEAASYYSLHAAAGTPSTAIAELNAAVQTALADSAVRTRLESEGMVVMSGSPEDANRFIRTYTEKWQKFIADSGISLR